MPAAPRSHIRVLPHIRRALHAGAPVVALESSVIAQGLPAPHNATADMIEPAIRSALAHAAKDRVRGGAVTPFLLDAVSSATKGQSLDTNLGLLESNARLAAEIAVAMSRGERSGA